MTRRPLISGNWKMNLNHFEAIQTVQKLHYVVPKETLEDVPLADKVTKEPWRPTIDRIENPVREWDPGVGKSEIPSASGIRTPENR